MLLKYNCKVKVRNNIRIVQAGNILLFLSLISGCKKFVNVNPPSSSLTTTLVYNNNASAAAVMSGVYVNMVVPSSLSNGNLSVSFLEGLASDECQEVGIDDIGIRCHHAV